MGIEFRGEGVTCKRCGQSIHRATELQWEETAHFGCQRCNVNLTPVRYFPKFCVDDGVWRIVEEKYVERENRWFWQDKFKLVRNYVATRIELGDGTESIITVNFPKCVEAMEYIKNNLQ